MTAASARSSERQRLISEVESLSQSDSLKVLPRLAAIDRSVHGYLTILSGWLLGGVVCVGLLLLAWIAATSSLRAITVGVHLFIELTSIVASQNYSVSVAATLFVLAGLQFRLFHKRVGMLSLYAAPQRAVMICLYPLRLLVIWVIAGRQFVIWVPLAVLAALGAQVCLMRMLQDLAGPRQILAALQPWQVSLPLALTSGLIIWTVSRRRLLWLIVMLMLMLAIIGGERVVTVAIHLTVQGGFHQELIGTSPSWTMMLAGGALLGLITLLPTSAVACYNGFLRVNVWVIDEIRLHCVLSRAFKAHRRRHEALVGSRSMHALCAACISRLEQVRERISYGRNYSYARCLLCGTDEHCAPNILRVEGIVNAPQPASFARRSAEVRGQCAEVQLNGYLVSDTPLPKALTTVVFLKASNRDIETFLLRYESQEQDRQITPRRDFVCRLTAEASVSTNLLKKLEKVFGHNLHVEEPSL